MKFQVYPAHNIGHSVIEAKTARQAVRKLQDYHDHAGSPRRFRMASAAIHCQAAATKTHSLR